VIGKKISYIDIPEEDARKGKMGMEDWLIDAIMEFYYIIKAGHASRTTNAVEQITGRKPVAFEQFVRDYASSFS
jgi:NAD(P)H dehydrogenase (quinone)